MERRTHSKCAPGCVCSIMWRSLQAREVPTTAESRRFSRSIRQYLHRIKPLVPFDLWPGLNAEPRRATRMSAQAVMVPTGFTNTSVDEMIEKFREALKNKGLESSNGDWATIQLAHVAVMRGQPRKCRASGGAPCWRSVPLKASPRGILIDQVWEPLVSPWCASWRLTWKIRRSRLARRVQEWTCSCVVSSPIQS